MYTQVTNKKQTEKKRSPIRKFGDHLEMLLYKQIMVMIHRWPTTLIRFLWPIVLMLIWKGTLIKATSEVGAKMTYNGNIPRCTTLGHSCITILYSNNNEAIITAKKKSLTLFFLLTDGCDNPNITDVMKHIAETNDPPLTMK